VWRNFEIDFEKKMKLKMKKNFSRTKEECCGCGIY